MRLYDAFAVADRLRVHRWVVPCYHIPDAPHVVILRCVLREDMTPRIAEALAQHFREAVEFLDAQAEHFRKADPECVSCLLDAAASPAGPPSSSSSSMSRPSLTPPFCNPARLFSPSADRWWFALLPPHQTNRRRAFEREYNEKWHPHVRHKGKSAKASNPGC